MYFVKIIPYEIVTTRLHLLIRTSRHNPPLNLIPKQLFKLSTHKVPTLIISCKGLFSTQNIKEYNVKNAIEDAESLEFIEDVGNRNFMEMKHPSVDENEKNNENLITECKDCREDLIWYCFKNTLIGFTAL